MKDDFNIATVTDHGEFRARKRVGVPKSAVERLAQKALDEGKERREFSGSLRRYLDGVWHRGGEKATIMVWAEKVYVFCDQALITVLDLPSKYKSKRRKSV